MELYYTPCLQAKDINNISCIIITQMSSPLMAVQASSLMQWRASSCSVIARGVPSLQQNSVFLLLQRRIQSRRLQPFPSFALRFGIPTLEGIASEGLAGVKLLLRLKTDFGIVTGLGRVNVIGGFLEQGL